jgi:hypothetical protein
VTRDVIVTLAAVPPSNDAASVTAAIEHALS